MNSDTVRYMAAYVALNARDGASVSSWSIRQIADSFAMLPPPPVDMTGWATRIDAMFSGEQDDSDRSARLNGASVDMANSASDLIRDGVLSIKDA